MIENVLDASAVLALPQNETGKEKVEAILEKSVISRVNVTGVLTKLIEKGIPSSEAQEIFAGLDLEVVEFDENQSIKAAKLRLATKSSGLSLGDQCCIALAIRESATAVTADKVWANLNFCKIEVVR